MLLPTTFRWGRVVLRVNLCENQEEFIFTLLSCVCAEREVYALLFGLTRLNSEAIGRTTNQLNCNIPSVIIDRKAREIIHLVLSVRPSVRLSVCPFV